MRTHITRWSLALAVMAFSGMAQAHPGHVGGYLAGIAHPFTGLDHLLAIIADGAEVIARAPDIIIGSWCGRKFQPDHVRARPGWQDVPAVRDDQLHEIKSADILAPGPTAITRGLPVLSRLFSAWAGKTAA